MRQRTLGRRSLLQGIAGAGAFTVLPGTARGTTPPTTDPHTRVTFAAAVDAVVPPTPDLPENDETDADDVDDGKQYGHVGEEHVPGAVEVGVDEYMITYVNSLLGIGSEELGLTGELRLAELVGLVLDAAATELVARGENTVPLDPGRVLDLLALRDIAADPRSLAAGPFAKLSRTDRLRALAMLDEKELDTAELPGPLVEADAGLVPQLIVGFSEVIYYSEWQGYDDIGGPPSERSHPNDPDSVQSWRQTGYPGFEDGNAAFRGYWGAPDSSLGGGRTWKTYKGPQGPRQLTFESGAFRENDYDTSDYEEVYPETGRTDGDTPVTDVTGIVRGEDPGDAPGETGNPTGTAPDPDASGTDGPGDGGTDDADGMDDSGFIGGRTDDDDDDGLLGGLLGGDD
ncbi:hypothetical protein [Haloglomus salinum]|uniref:hypothetical protein n=1 Tax=Haloglomus salinum TaxID=2962673 RepID=UPI0020C98697|nr:hypothetical protein [Haloglomus salinum]